jgi:hypothetical protein
MKNLLESVHINLGRVYCLLLITIFGLLSLCLMKDIDALAPFSALGIASVGVAMLSMIMHCLDGRTYTPGGSTTMTSRQSISLHLETTSVVDDGVAIHLNGVSVLGYAFQYSLLLYRIERRKRICSGTWMVLALVYRRLCILLLQLQVFGHLEETQVLISCKIIHQTTLLHLPVV